jgi:hypothetical protein
MKCCHRHHHCLRWHLHSFDGYSSGTPQICDATVFAAVDKNEAVLIACAGRRTCLFFMVDRRQTHMTNQQTKTMTEAILFNKPSGPWKTEEWKCPATTARGSASTGDISVEYYGAEPFSVSSVGNCNMQGPKITFTFASTRVEFTYACSTAAATAASAVADMNAEDLESLFNWKHPTTQPRQVKIVPDRVLACRSVTSSSASSVDVMMQQGVFRVTLAPS